MRPESTPSPARKPAVDIARRTARGAIVLALAAGGGIALAGPASASGEATTWAQFLTLLGGECTGNVVTLGANLTAPTGESALVDGAGCDVTVDLAGHTLTVADAVTSGDAAIGVGGSSSLTITDSVGGGSLTAVGGYGAAGIGGGQSTTPGTIVIAGGTVTATGGIGAAGIGGGQSGDGGVITVSGGTVTATGMGAAGIGGGEYGSGGTITISGGTITAKTGLTSGAGIGSGPYTSGGSNSLTGGTIAISGGSVTATGGADAAGIGGGEHVVGGDVTISGGTVTATGGNSAPGIGSGAGAGIGAGIAGTLTIQGSATPGSADLAGPTSISGTIGAAASLDYTGGPWVEAVSTVGTGGALHVEFVPSLIATIAVSGPTTAQVGDSVDFTAEGFDQFGASMGDVTATASWSSDVADDTVRGNTVTFNHASPHTITAVIDDASGDLVVEVSAAASPSPSPSVTPSDEPDDDSLAATGANSSVALATAGALLLAGVAVVGWRRRA